MTKKIEIELNCFSLEACVDLLSIKGCGDLKIYENLMLINIDPIFSSVLVHYEENKKYKITIEEK